MGITVVDPKEPCSAVFLKLQLRFYFSLGLEQFYLLNEIESFFHASPQLVSTLQRWILSKAQEIFDTDVGDVNVNVNDDKPDVENAALDILEWAPMESMVNALRQMPPWKADTEKRQMGLLSAPPTIRIASSMRSTPSPVTLAVSSAWLKDMATNDAWNSSSPTALPSMTK